MSVSDGAILNPRDSKGRFVKGPRPWMRLPRITVTCSWCGTKFKRKISRVNKGNNFCSRKCFQKGKRKRQQTKVTILACDYCGKKFRKYESQIKKAKHHFCSRQCSAKFYGLQRLKKVVVTCLFCGKKFKREPSAIRHERQFCCRECAIQWQRKVGREKWVLVKCVYCGREFLRPPSKIVGKVSFCSLECQRLKAKSRNVTVECSYCGKVFVKTPAELRKWKKEGDKHHFCSRECCSRFYSGENHPNWRGGYEPYYGSNWYSQRKKALARDNYQCQVCGKTDNLHVHHIIPVQKFDKKEEANYLNNLITLCNSCHSNVEWGNIECPTLKY